MRLSNDRYSRDLRSFNLAMRMLSHEARTHTVCLWTKLSEDRVRNLSDLHHRECSRKAHRFRGPAPTQMTKLLEDSSLRSEIDALAALCLLQQLIPAQPVANARANFPNVARGEHLCSILELFRGLVPNSRVSFEQLSLLVLSLASGAQWGPDRCTRCAVIIVVDRHELTRRPICEDCQREGQGIGSKSLAKAEVSPVASWDGQLSLFEAPNTDTSCSG